MDLAYAGRAARGAAGGLVGGAGWIAAAHGDTQRAEPAPVAGGFRGPARRSGATHYARRGYRPVAGADAVARLDVSLRATVAAAARLDRPSRLRDTPGDAVGVPGGRTSTRAGTAL